METFFKIQFLVKMICFIQATKEMAIEHYSDRVGLSCFDESVEYITSGPIIPMIWEGANAIKIGRKMIGNYNPNLSVEGTIRGVFGTSWLINVIHGSDSVDKADDEIDIWFKEHEVIPPRRFNDTFTTRRMIYQLNTSMKKK